MERKIKKRRISFRLRERNKGNLLRLVVYRSNSNIYSQILNDQTRTTLVYANTLEKTFKDSGKKGYNIEGAHLIGKMLGEKAQKAGISKIVFDRSGYLFCGRIKALADGARDFIEF